MRIAGWWAAQTNGEWRASKCACLDPCFECGAVSKEMCLFRGLEPHWHCIILAQCEAKSFKCRCARG